MAVAFDNQKWLDDFYKETGERGWFDGRLYTADYLRWCVKRAAELMEEQYTSTNNARVEIAACVNMLNSYIEYHGPDSELNSIVERMRQLSPVA